MKRLALLGAALALLATPAQAQAPKKLDNPVYGFNGNVFDPPGGLKAVAPKPVAAPKAAQAKGPAKKAPLAFNGNVFD